MEATTSNAPSGEGRIRSLMALGDQFAKFVTPTDVRDAIDSGKSPEQFREVILNKMESRAMDTRVVGLTPTEAGRYSLARALVASITGDWTHAGFERECSRTLERTNGRNAEGIFVPSEVWGARRDFNVGTASEAGNLVPTIMRGDLFVDALRDRMVMGRLGVRILSGLSGNVDIPRKATASTLGMLSEIGSASETNPTTAKLTLQPRRIGAYVDVSKQALIQSALPLEAMLRDDLLMGAAVLIENQAMNGVGLNSEMTGLRNTANIGTVVGGSNGAALAWSHILDLEAACANANANPGPLAGYLLNSRTLNKAKQVTKSTYLGFLVDSDQALDANGFLRLNNTRAGVSNLLPSTLTKGTSTSVCSAALYSSDWSMAVLGLFGAPDIVVDQVTQAVTGQVRVVLNQFADFGVRQPKAFAKIEDLLTT